MSEFAKFVKWVRDYFLTSSTSSHDKKTHKHPAGRTEEKKRNRCLTCAKMNTRFCPYGDDQFCTVCDSYVLIGFLELNNLSTLSQPVNCPECGSKDTSRTSDNRFECHQCKRLFS